MRSLDANRLGQAVGGRPGIDPRSWVFLARITAWNFVPDVGGLCMVQALTGPLVGEDDIACTIPSSFARPGAFSHSPVELGTTAVVLVPDGNPNIDPQVIAFVLGPSAVPPKTVASQPVSEGLLQASHVFADPTKEANIELAALRLVTDTINLVKADPTQPFVRGADFVKALTVFLDALGTFTAVAAQQCDLASAASIGPLSGYKPMWTAIGTALASLGGTLPSFVPSGGVVPRPKQASAVGVLESKLVDGVTLSTHVKAE